MRLLCAVLTSLCFGLAACSPPDEDLDPSPGDASRLGRYIVRLQEPALGAQAPSVRDQAVDLTTRYGGTIVQVYETSFRGFAVADLPLDRAQALSFDPAVARIEKDAPIMMQ
jgi:starvation-inducible outer membrane lipoprotein